MKLREWQLKLMEEWKLKLMEDLIKGKIGLVKTRMGYQWKNNPKER